MSMISSQCDELRDWACELRNLANGPVNEGFPARAKLFESADAMCQAADTILELRDDLQRANDAVQDAEHDESTAWDRVRKAEAENAKLRELADAVKEFVEDTHCEECPFRRDCDDNNRIFCVNDFSYHAFVAMRELGMEMDR